MTNDSKTRDVRPLAARMRPTTLIDYIGQKHLLGNGKPLRRALESGQLHSMILWGPPGTGKTTFAEMATSYSNAKIERVSAVTSGVKDIRLAIEKAMKSQLVGRHTILFVDEVHRFNKRQQDAFLPHIEDGTITFIGATTENPSFELNNSLLSRTCVYKLKSLDKDEICEVIDQVISDTTRGLGNENIIFLSNVKEQLANITSGDARMALNYLELLSDMAEPDDKGMKVITLALLAEVVGENISRFDNKGDYWYDLISAFHKSVRGSNPHAALYWYARIITAGGDPLYVARRLLAIASEDIGNADPRAMQIAINAWDCFTRVGSTEGERAIAQAAVYIACAPKSNAVYSAWEHALSDAKMYPNYDVPNHLRNTPIKLMKEIDGDGYHYPHDEPNAYAVGENYFPAEMKGKQYYQPVHRGLEIRISEKLTFLEQLEANNSQKF
ncbi:replication-associated recombination protein A [Candidatus Enterovibrio escicola]|uniref:replication-associated recombination protein A n=1 Tax=Candidatus Enterovibrio escicola TaxID=1927127 RepID=UPI001237B110|nr:replication-associated recombination protein A [Candidatus Enterovibrio escacola]